MTKTNEWEKRIDYLLKHQEDCVIFDEIKREVNYLLTQKDAERADWLRSEIEELEGMKDDYPVDAQPTTNEYEVRINWANPVVHEALTSIITRYKEELLDLENHL